MPSINNSSEKRPHNKLVFRFWLALMITAIIPLSIILIQSCSKTTKTPTGSPVPFAGFEAEIYEYGALVAKCSTGTAILTDPLTFGYIEIAGSKDDYNFRLTFHSKGSGLDGMSPGTLDTANFSEPFIHVDSAGIRDILMAYIGRYDYPLDSLWFFPDSVVGSGSGTISKVNATGVAGDFSGIAKNDSWEIKNCHFNLTYQ
jgi:hypothetical protein